MRTARMILHDTRLDGAPKKLPDTFILAVDGSISLSSALGSIKTYADAHGGLERLDIMCHGYEGGVEDTSGQESVLAGGYGLKLCSENLTRANVDLLSMIKGCIDRIVIYACAPAQTQNQNRGGLNDGMALMKEIVIYTDAQVVASDTIQEYMRIKLLGVSFKDIDFGEWEGNVYLFDRTLSVTKLANHNFKQY